MLATGNSCNCGAVSVFSPSGRGVLVGVDHFIEGKFRPDAEWVAARAYEMHDHPVETFHRHVVTEKAIEVWR